MLLPARAGPGSRGPPLRSRDHPEPPQKHDGRRKAQNGDEQTLESGGGSGAVQTRSDQATRKTPTTNRRRETYGQMAEEEVARAPRRSRSSRS